jgi:hypothetical protein
MSTIRYDAAMSDVVYASRVRIDLKSIATGVGLVLAGIAGGFHLAAQGRAGAAPPAAAPAPPADTAELRAQYEQWRKDFKTWGRWGTGDNKGTSNLITPQKVLNAARLIKRLNRYEFAMTFAPLPVEGGTGSPVNPLAIF